MATKEIKEMKGSAVEPTVPRKSSKMLIMLIALVLVTVIGGGGAVVYFLMKKPTTDKKSVEAKEEQEPVFLPLDPFTVNLKGTQERFTQVAITLMIIDPKAVDPIKARTPVLRDRILKVIGRKSAEDMLSAEGKEKLAAEVLASVKDSLPETLRKGVKEVLFTNVIVQ
jgi:flagellar FliL protein